MPRNYKGLGTDVLLEHVFYLFFSFSQFVKLSNQLILVINIFSYDIEVEILTPWFHIIGFSQCIGLQFEGNIIVAEPNRIIN